MSGTWTASDMTGRVSGTSKNHQYLYESPSKPLREKKLFSWWRNAGEVIALEAAFIVWGELLVASPTPAADVRYLTTCRLPDHSTDMLTGRTAFREPRSGYQP